MPDLCCPCRVVTRFVAGEYLTAVEVDPRCECTTCHLEIGI